MPPPLLALQDVVLSLGTVRLLDGASLSVGAGDRICLVGRNGSGKSTLLRVATGGAAIDAGSRFLQPGATMRALAQEPDLSAFTTVGECVRDGLDPTTGDAAALAMLDELGLDPARPTATLSGGETKRAALVRAMAANPDLLLLDEPTNHLDLPGIEWLERRLAASRRTGLVLISHDRRLLETVASSVVWLDLGATRRMDRGFAHFEAWRDEVLAEAEAEHHRLGRKIAREEDWMRYGVTARRKRNVRRVAELAALRRTHRDTRRGDGSLNLGATEAALSGRLVAVAEDVAKAWPDPDGAPRQVIRDLSLRVLRGDRLGIVGANGVGKTTLLRILTGDLPPDAGSVTLGAALSLATLDQQRRTLDPARPLADTLTDGAGDHVSIGGEKRHVVGVMKDFLFRPEQARTPVGTLSGGERGRLALACALIRPSNLLVLDEPTNDLDLETLDLLQELLATYPGTVILVSHDRDFLDRVATSVLVSDAGGTWIEYAGGWSDMLAQRGGSPFSSTEPATRASQATPSRRTEARAAASPAKLSFKDAHALRTLPGEIARLEADIARHDAALADPDLYRRDRARFETATTGAAHARNELAEAEERWLALELRREELEQARQA